MRSRDSNTNTKNTNTNTKNTNKKMQIQIQDKNPPEEEGGEADNEDLAEEDDKVCHLVDKESSEDVGGDQGEGVLRVGMYDKSCFSITIIFQ